MFRLPSFTRTPSTIARGLLLSLCLPLAVLQLSGCATIEGWFSNSNSTAAIQAATSLAVGETILSGKTPAAQAQTAKDILSVTAKVQTALNGSVTIAQLSALVQAQVAKLGNQQEVLAINSLLTFLSAEFAGKISTGLLKPTDVVIVNTFCGWVTTAATPYAGS